MLSKNSISNTTFQILFCAIQKNNSKDNQNSLISVQYCYKLKDADNKAFKVMN